MEWDWYDIRRMTDEEYRRWFWMMEEEKRRRVERFRREADRRRSVAADMLARRMISAACGIPPEQVRLATEKGGKPYAPGSPLHFSLSHSGDLAVCGVDRRPVGIDVERIRPVNLKAARRIAAPEELVRLFGREPTPEDFRLTGDPELLDRFFELWTGKEAAGKLTGEGLLSGGRTPAELRYFRQIPGYLVCVATVKGSGGDGDG